MKMNFDPENATSGSVRRTLKLSRYYIIRWKIVKVKKVWYTILIKQKWRQVMTIALSIIAVLLLLSVVYLKKFMSDMAIVESNLIAELREIKGYMKKMSEK